MTALERKVKAARDGVSPKDNHAVKRSLAVALIWAVTLITATVIAFDIVPWLRGDAPWIPDDGQWIWTHEAPHWPWVLPAAAGLALYVAGAIALLRRTQASARYPVGLTLWAFGGIVLLTLLLMNLENSPLFLLLVRLTTQGHFHAASAEITSLEHTLRHWPDFTAWLLAETGQSNGVVLSPPGIAAVYYAVAQGFEQMPARTSRWPRGATRSGRARGCKCSCRFGARSA